MNRNSFPGRRAILEQLLRLRDADKISSTVTDIAGRIDAATLRAVHTRIESGSAHGKIVLEGF